MADHGTMQACLDRPVRSSWESSFDVQQPPGGGFHRTVAGACFLLAAPSQASAMELSAQGVQPVASCMLAKDVLGLQWQALMGVVGLPDPVVALMLHLHSLPTSHDETCIEVSTHVQGTHLSGFHFHDVAGTCRLHPGSQPHPCQLEWALQPQLGSKVQIMLRYHPLFTCVTFCVRLHHALSSHREAVQCATFEAVAMD